MQALFEQPIIWLRKGFPAYRIEAAKREAYIDKKASLRRLFSWK